MFLAAAQAAEVAGKTGGLFSWENLIRNMFFLSLLILFLATLIGLIIKAFVFLKPSDPFFGHAHRPYHQGLQPR